MKKKKTALMMAAVMTVSLLAACGQKTSAPAAESTAQPDAAQTTEASKEASQEESQAPAESTGEVTELKVFGFKTGAEEGAIPDLIEQFNKENPDIHVVYEGISNAGGYQDVLTARLASGQGDDVFFANPNYLPQMQEAGYVEDLTDMPVVANYSDLVKDLLTINDSIPGLGMEIAVFGMFSNMDVLNEVGIEKAPENYKEFLEDCQILKDAGKTPIVAGAKDGTAMAIFAVAKSLDPVYQAPDKMDQIAKINTGELMFGDIMRPGYEVVEELISKGYMDGSKALVYAPGQDDIAEFAKGETGFMPGGSWFVAGLENAAPDMNYTLGGIPVQDEDSLILINAGVRVCINSASEKKEAARKFVEFFTSLDSMNAYVASQNSFNPRVDGKSTDNAVVEPAAERLTAARMVPWVDSAFNTAVVSPWADARTYAANIAAGDSVDNAVKDLNTQIENNLKLN